MGKEIWTMLHVENSVSCRSNINFLKICLCRVSKLDDD
jgi:hypothetical protein